MALLTEGGGGLILGRWKLIGSKSLVHAVVVVIEGHRRRPFRRLMQWLLGNFFIRAFSPNQKLANAS